MSQQLDFFNTIHLFGPELKEAEGKADRQNQRVLNIVKGLGKATPFQVAEVYNRMYPECPLTSIRRAMTCLTDQGKLEMLDEMKKEKFGHNNHYWKVCE